MSSRVASREGGKLSVRTSIPRTALMALGSALLTAAAGALCATWFVTLPEQAAGMSLVLLVVTRLATLPIFVVCLVGVLLFGWGSIFFLGRLLFFRRPVFEVGPEGILDRASAVGVGFVPWEDVKDVRPAVFHGQRSIAIRVRSERELLERQNPVKRLLIGINRRYFGSAPIHVPLNALAVPEEELAAEITRYLSLRGEADKKFRSGVRAGRPKGGMANRRRLPRSTPAHPALRIAGSVARGIAVVVLSLVYYVISAGLIFPGVALLWNGLSPGVGNPDLEHPVTGAILLVVGVLTFVFFPRLVKRLTGREVISGPYGGFGGGGGGS